ncbi:NAD(P)-binding protein, partial [Polychaeton citri CBS 116435]
MAPTNHLQKVVLVGASGNTGKVILSSLLTSPAKFNITVIARPESKANLPSTINVIRMSYGPDADQVALTKAFEGQDVAIFCLAPAATMDQLKLIDAAAAAGVKWIVPNEWANDGSNKEMVDRVPGFLPKRQAREAIEAKGVKWIG